MSQQQGNSALQILNTKYGSTSRDTLVQLNPFEDMSHYAVRYRECADRLVASRTGAPLDDVILMPFLMLYRQAYELLLKDLALRIATHQVRFGESSPDYSIDNMKLLIRKDWGHSLHRSFTWVREEIETLDLSEETLPVELTDAITLLHDIDPGGTAFRYPDDLLMKPLNINIYKLQDDLSRGIEWLWAVYSHTDEMLSAAPSASDYK